MASRGKQSGAAANPGKNVKFARVAVHDDRDVSASNASDNADDCDEESPDLAKTAEQMIQLASQLKKKDDWPQKFGKVIDDRQVRFQSSLEEARKKITNEKQRFEQGLVPLLQQALAPPNEPDASEIPSDNTIRVAYTSASGQSYFNHIASLIGDAQGLLDSYKKIAGQRQECSHLADIGTTFQKDEQTTRRAITAGQQTTLLDVERLLADKYHEVRGRSGLSHEDEELGRLLLSKGVVKEQITEGSTGWGNVASDLTKAVDKLAQTSQRR